MKHYSSKLDAMARSVASSYSSEHPFVASLGELATIGIEGLRTDGVWASSARTNLRYIAALFPDYDLRQLAQTVADIIGNPRLPVHNVRLVLAGRSLADPSRVTLEAPIEAIQTVGRVLMSGGTQVQAARASGLSRSTVAAIDGYLGLSDTFDMMLVGSAADAIRENVSVRRFAKVYNLSKSTAHRYMKRAYDTLVELGEVSQ